MVTLIAGQVSFLSFQIYYNIVHSASTFFPNISLSLFISIQKNIKEIKILLIFCNLLVIATSILENFLLEAHECINTIYIYIFTYK